MRNPLVVAVIAVSAASVFAESAAGMRWTAPASWKAEAARPMRAATYSIALAAGDQGIAECVVNYFGPGQGGGVDANIERWRGQVLGADGKPAHGENRQADRARRADYGDRHLRHLHRHGRPDDGGRNRRPAIV